MYKALKSVELAIEVEAFLAAILDLVAVLKFYHKIATE